MAKLRARRQATFTKVGMLAATVAAGAALLGAPAPAAGTPAERAERARCPDRAVSVEAGTSASISLRCRGLAQRRVRIRRRPAHGLLGRIDQKRDRVAYRPEDGYEGSDRLVAVRKRGDRRYRTAVEITVLAPGPVGAAPECSAPSYRVNYQTPEQLSVTCRGDGLAEIRVTGGPASGSLANVEVGGDGDVRTLTATYTPDDLFVGGDEVVVEAAGADGNATSTVSLTVQPWRMRAIGDSVTAGFGYFADGSLMTVDDLLDCKPAAVVSNRCSSNSPAGPGYSGPPSWTSDFGLGNDVSWAAQFANDWQGGGKITAPQMFQNRAVTGSAPSDWLPGGLLAGELDAIVGSNPDLIAMTMGANPLLTDVLLTEAGEECAFTDTVSELEACLVPFFSGVDLVANLQRLYTAALAAPDAEVVTFEYHLAVPAANLFDVWQLEAMIDFFNEQISTAVANTKAAVPSSQAARLHLIEAQRDPQAPDPQLLPRFDIGLPPAAQQTWTAGYDCGDIFTDLVDGQSHQSEPTQDELFAEEPDTFCSGSEWIIAADTGIHPNAAGYAQFAAALTAVASAEDLVPELP